MIATWIIGVDCAVQARNVGVVLASWDAERAHVEEVHRGPSNARMSSWAAELIAPWLESNKVLLALDAPLGWPLALSHGLRDHQAGQPLGTSKGEHDRLFRRRTDEVVKSTLGKSPLDVGADRIARTAHAALELLAKLREASGCELPLAWHPGRFNESAVIEVYPAATVRTHPNMAPRDKQDDDHSKRIFTSLASLLDMAILGEDAKALMTACDHVMDAALCVLAAQDFLRGEVLSVPDEDVEVVRREGWIWFRDPDHREG